MQVCKDIIFPVILSIRRVLREDTGRFPGAGISFFVLVPVFLKNCRVIVTLLFFCPFYLNKYKEYEEWSDDAIFRMEYAE
ncbi:MAG TPA: hypothetical protein DD657_13265 [Culturomica sp.]|nr:hypothetical protein [Culturomica sp.]